MGAALFDRRSHPQKSSFEEAIKAPLIAVLISPNFLYLTEDNSFNGKPKATVDTPPNTTASRLNHYELASRLSYFLWSSMPDDELFQLARQQRLSSATTLRQQVDRMLSDSKSVALAENFAGQWLGLREVGVNPPSTEYFRRYDDHLHSSLIRESEGFYAEILHNDLPVKNFIKSDFVTINERLSRFYNIDNVRGDHIRRVPVPAGVHRGGVLTQASMLTITSNGTRTSPVMRGKWILDNILGDPPPPPPPDAGEIPQKVPGVGQVTVRRRLELHRQLPACSACHNKIDPLGFALENFRGALALQTDTTRVATFQMGKESNGGSYAELGIQGDQHTYSHHGGDETMLATLAKIDRFLVEQWVYFLNRLQSTPDGDGTLLDRTMILFGSGMNSGKTGTHSPSNLPLLFAGGSKLGIRQGQHLKFEPGSTPFSNLLQSMLQSMAIDTRKFSDSTGTLTGLS